MVEGVEQGWMDQCVNQGKKRCKKMFKIVTSGDGSHRQSRKVDGLSRLSKREQAQRALPVMM